jgi:hypothetical protein
MSNALIGSELLTAAPSDRAALKKVSNAIRKSESKNPHEANGKKIT